MCSVCVSSYMSVCMPSVCPALPQGALCSGRYGMHYSLYVSVAFSLPPPPPPLRLILLDLIFLVMSVLFITIPLSLIFYVCLPFIGRLHPSTSNPLHLFFSSPSVVLVSLIPLSMLFLSLCVLLAFLFHLYISSFHPRVSLTPVHQTALL